MPCDAQTVLMMHMDGTDASTSFIDSSVSAKTLTAVGNAQIDTAQSVFGGASGLYDGTGDYVTAADSADWYLDDGSDLNSWTIDFRARYVNATTNKGVIGHSTDNNNCWNVLLNSAEFRFVVRASSSIVVDIEVALTDAADTWYHYAVVKNGASGYMMFQNGTQIGTTELDTTGVANYTGLLTVGRSYNGDGSLKEYNGWLDELRISKGIARWTANFTPSTAAYCGGANINRFMLMGAS